jgi:rRNA maturation endonuclease Nob1
MTSILGWYFCLKCGAELSADARFCPICGHPVGATPAP